MAKGSDKLTPAMRQFHRFKKQHPGCVLFFRLGDFYEMFYDDAKLAHRVLGVTLTQRTEGVPMAGVPYHSVEGYLRRMIQAGHRVAVCDQVEDPRQARGVVDRDVTRVVTPGTLTDETLLDEGQENPLAAVVFHGAGSEKSTRTPGNDQTQQANPDSNATASLAWVELSTGVFRVATLTVAEVADELARIAPRELLYCETATGETPPRVEQLARPLDIALTGRPAWQFRQNEAVEILQRQYGVSQLAGFGFDDDDPALAAVGGIVHYLLETQRSGGGGGRGAGQKSGVRGQRSEGQGHTSGRPTSDSEHQQSAISNQTSLAHLQPPRRFVRTDHLVVDQTSLRSLEIERTMRSGEVKGSLVDVLQDCVTAMGKRLLRQWLCYPLRERAPIERRQRVVESLVGDSRFVDELREALDSLHDVPRIIGRLAVNRATPRDLVGLGESAKQVRTLERVLADRESVSPYHDRLAAVVEPVEALATRIGEACVDDPPAHLREGGLIRDGFDAQLDEARSLQRDSHDWLARYQKKLIEQSDIPSLKVGYNKVYGYYIEVTAAHREKIKDDEGVYRGWSRKQTLKNAERYITPELKEFEHKVLSAEERAVAREQDLFALLCGEAQQQIDPLHRFAEAAAELDVLACFGRRAVRKRYVRPTIVEEPVLHIEGGRHPVLDEVLGDRFVPNDVSLGCRESEVGSCATEEEHSSEVNGQGSGIRRKESGDRREEASDIRNPQFAIRNSSPTLALITGPNMAGKSTYIRQTALITLLAHTGSFVPADAATIGLTDRIFTRIGASDELHAGQSTFMVEMTEAANLCHHATPRSLVILDEIGRGTSTLDGLSLAWAMAEFLARVQGPESGVRSPESRSQKSEVRGQGADAQSRPAHISNPQSAIRNASTSNIKHPTSNISSPGPRTLFATHYHELTALAATHPSITNLNVTVREWQDQIVFLHRIEPGKADRSYGIHVAKLAGMPRQVVERADDLLRELAVSHQGDDGAAATATQDHADKTAAAARSAAAHHAQRDEAQMSLFTEYLPHPVVEQVRSTDVTRLSPMEAFDLLRELHEQIAGEGLGSSD